MRGIVVSLLSGTVFGAGLAVSGMTDPHRVRGFLDLFGIWDPTLVFVMGGAVLVMAVVWQIQRRMGAPFFADAFSLPTRKDIDARLLAGSALFGVGWGIAGLCPGPGFASLAIAPANALLFLGGLLAGMVLFRMTLDT